MYSQTIYKVCWVQRSKKEESDKVHTVWYWSSLFSHVILLVLLWLCTFKSQREKMYLRTIVPREDFDQLAHVYSLIRVFAGTLYTAKAAMFPQTDNEDWSACADAQADQSLRWVFVSQGAFYHIVAFFVISFVLFTKPIIRNHCPGDHYWNCIMCKGVFETDADSENKDKTEKSVLAPRCQHNYRWQCRIYQMTATET